MRIKWYGTASLLIEGGGARILVDPYLKSYNKKMPPVPVEEATSAEAVFITHAHFDHFRDIGAFTGGNVKNIYVSANGIERARENGIPTGKMLPLEADQEINVGGMTVRSYQSRHCKFDIPTVLGVVCNPVTYFKARTAVKLLKETKKFPIKDDIYALEFIADGKRVVVLGSAGMDERVSYPDGADLLVFPYQGRTRMHKYMISFLQTFRPKAVMLDHFDNAFPPLTHTVKTKKFRTVAKKNFPSMRAFVPEEGTWYEI